MVEPLRHPNCSGEHPGKEAKVGPFPEDRSQCYLCWLALNEPGRVRALAENRPWAAKAAEPVEPVKTRWPWRWRLLALLRRPGDRGVGDTAARLLGYVGGEWLKRRWVRFSKKDCGCSGRQGRLNGLFPYR